MVILIIPASLFEEMFVHAISLYLREGGAFPRKFLNPKDLLFSRECPARPSLRMHLASFKTFLDALFPT